MKIKPECERKNAPEIGFIYAEYNSLSLCVSVFLRHVTRFLLSVRIIVLRRFLACPSGVFCASHTLIVLVIQLNPPPAALLLPYGATHGLRGQRSLPSCSRVPHAHWELIGYRSVLGERHFIIFDDIFSDAPK